jgi:exonuclease III
MASPNLLLLNWNVRGLNAPVRRSRVKDMVCVVKAFIACPQETKVQVIDELMISEILGPKFKNNYSFLATDATSGGILIAASEDYFKLLSCSRSKYSLTVRMQALIDASEWTLTSVYGPQLEAGKFTFLEEIRALQQAIRVSGCYAEILTSFIRRRIRVSAG